ncbi:NAD(+)/NADH kinase [Christensenellaceae bacterium OttesenSCG-928-L17]|nr:NAD(+)/NADH kinase [Christensenellaceae bacterium OttesenSCG-928-L17]
MTTGIVFFANPTKEEALAVRETVSAIARQHGYPCYFIDSPDDTLPHGAKNPAFLVAIGGDGTILKAAPFASRHQIPILGINLGRVGFLSEILPGEFEDALTKYEHGALTLDSRSMLACKVNGQEIGVSLNDILLYKESFSGVAHISIHINGDDAGTVFCDGVVVSTSTGATGYSISAGGPIIAPGLDASIVTPICPHSLLARPIVASQDAIIRLCMHSPGCLYADGQKLMDVDNTDEIEITRSPLTTSFLRMSGHNLYSLVKEKLT